MSTFKLGRLIDLVSNVSPGANATTISGGGSGKFSSSDRMMYVPEEPNGREVWPGGTVTATGYAVHSCVRKQPARQMLTHKA